MSAHRWIATLADGTEHVVDHETPWMLTCVRGDGTRVTSEVVAYRRAGESSRKLTTYALEMAEVFLSEIAAAPRMDHEALSVIRQALTPVRVALGRRVSDAEMQEWRDAEAAAGTPVAITRGRSS